MRTIIPLLLLCLGACVETTPRPSIVQAPQPSRTVEATPLATPEAERGYNFDRMTKGD